MKYGTEFEMYLIKKVKINGTDRYTVSVEVNDFQRHLVSLGKKI